MMSINLNQCVYYMKKSIKFNSSNIIKIRQNIDKKKKDYWKIIRAENVMSNKEIKAGLGSGKDIKALYNEITQLSEKLVYIKGMLAALNTGETTFDKNAFKKTNNYSIFMATEMKEAVAQLKMVPTIDPATKAKKGGASKMGKSEIFTSAKIASLIKELQLKATKYDNDMEEFNSNNEIDIASLSDDFKEYLAV